MTKLKYMRRKKFLTPASPTECVKASLFVCVRVGVCVCGCIYDTDTARQHGEGQSYGSCYGQTLLAAVSCRS